MEDIQNKLEDTNWEITEDVNRWKKGVRFMVLHVSSKTRLHVSTALLPFIVCSCCTLHNFCELHGDGINYECLNGVANVPETCRFCKCSE